MSALTRLMRADSSRSGRSVPRIRRFFAGVFPASDWRVGTSNDVDQLIHQKSLVLRNIRVPTLVLHGTQDVIVPLVVAEDNAAQIPRARLIMIAGGSHVMMATHAEEINKAIRQSTDLERSG